MWDDFEEDSNSKDRWLISYADMITLLFAIFVFLYSLNQATKTDEGLFQFSSSMRAAFHPPFENVPEKDQELISKSGVGVFENYKGNKLRPDIIETYPNGDLNLEQSKKIAEQRDQDFKKVKLKILNQLYGKHMSTEMGSTGMERILNIQKTKEGFRLRLAGRFGFKQGRYVLDNEASQDLKELTSTLISLNRPIMIESHTTTNESKDVWDLSLRRSIEVFKLMTQSYRFPKQLASISAYADTHPVDQSIDLKPELNRRIDINVRYSAK